MNTRELEELASAPPSVGRTAIIDRPRLLRRLTAEPKASIAVVVAPAGYGKTTLMNQWDAFDHRPFIWVRLDSRHDDATMLTGAIASALDRVEPLGDAVFAPLMAPCPNLWKVVLPRLCGAVSSRESPFVLVLDDLHRVRDQTALEPLAMIAESVPDGSRLAIASREVPAVPLGRLRTQRGVIELGRTELAMTASEAGALFARLGGRLDEDGLERLLERTEGWPAGIYLAALTIGDSDDVGTAVKRFCGDDRMVAEYLQEEFVSTLSTDDRLFLTRSSVLDHPSGPVCDAVLGRVGSQSVLKRLAKSNMLLSPTDRRDREYRCHALLREMLAAELVALGENEQAELHARASEWYAGQGEIDRAVDHAIAAGDRERAADLIWAVTTKYETGGRHNTLQRWLAEFSEEELVSLPPLCLTMAASRTTLGDGVGCEHWTAAALEALKSCERSDTEILAIAARVIRAAGAAREGVVKMREDASSAAGLLPDSSPWRSLCSLLEGVSLHLTGDLESARRMLEEGARRGSASAANIATLCRAQLALIAIDEGDQESASDAIRGAREQAEHFGLVEHPTEAIVFSVSALLRARDGDSAAATRDLKAAERLLGELNDFSPWYEIETRVVLARTVILLDDVAKARALLAAAGRMMQRCPDATVLREWIESAWQEVEAATSVTGRWPLSPAELRLLHQLPTHLTFRDIAEHQFVSPNTVKTQARSIYRKLGVSSRAEAVECARAAGLIGSADDAGARSSVPGDSTG